MKEYWKLMADGQEHTDGLTFEEATDMAEEYKAMFPNTDYYPSQDYEYAEKEERENRFYNSNACDGWEDIYPLDEG